MEALAGTVPLEPPVPTRDGRGRWDLSGATAYQKRLRSLVEARDRIGRVRVVAGADVSYARGDTRLYAAVVTLDASTLQVLETTGVRAVARFPYLPGYLSFREAPAVVEAFASLRRLPDLLLVDGHGVAHPRGFGLACHLGLLLDVPSIGVAKTILVGETDDPAQPRGSRARLVHRGKRLGTALRTRGGVKPVYVSVGHRVSLRTAERLALECTGRFRIPEPTRRAHQEVNRLRREEIGGRRR